METNYAKSAYRTFLFWGVCSSLGVTVSTLVDATLVGNFIGSTGLAVANIATPVFLLYLLMGITLGGGAGVLIGKKLGEADLKGANRFFGSVLSAGLITGVLFAAASLVFRSALCQSAWCHTGAFAKGFAVSDCGVCLCPDLCVI